MGVSIYLTLSLEPGGHVVLVEEDRKKTRTTAFPLTNKGCLEAGAFLFAIGATEWLCSSSIDYPRETDPSFKGSIRDLLKKGFKDAWKKSQPVPRVFWFHYNRPESLRQKTNILTVHQSGVCHLVTGVQCNVPIETMNRKTQPRCVLRGKGVVRVVDGVATIDAE